MRLVSFLLLFAVISCRPAEQIRRETTLYLNLDNDPITFNPLVAEDAYSNMINSKIHEGLLRRDAETLEFRGALAESWEIAKDHLTYTFRLRKNARFHDGHPVTSKDVLYSYKKLMDPKTPNPFMKVYYQDVDSVRAPDEYTVVFKMKKPYFKSIDFLGGFDILPEHLFSREADFINNIYSMKTPVGAGPYKLKEWKTGQRVVLDLNEDYHGTKPEIKQYYYRIIKNEAVALQALKKRDIDMLNLKPFQWTRQTNSENFKRHFQKIKYIGSGYRYVGYNTRRPPFDDVRTRRAMTMLMNRTKILEALMENLGVEVTGPFNVSGLQYDPTIKPLPYDRAGARKLLAESGWRDSDGDGILDRNGRPFRFELLIPAAAPFYEQFAAIIKEDLKEAGVIVEIRKLEFQVLVERANKRDYEALMMGWSTPLESDPYQLWHSSQLAKGHNFTGFSTKEMDKLIEDARVEFDSEKRNALYRKLHAIIYEGQPYTFLFTSYNLVALHRRFENVQVYRAGLDPDRWTIRTQWQP